MGRGGGNSGNKRSRTVDDDDKGGPTKVQLKGLQWNESAGKPAFLRNAYAALSGPRISPAQSSLTEVDTGRPAIPTRPERDPNGDREDEDSEEDEWDLARGEEAPAVVVLKEGKHLGMEEVSRMRAEAKANSAPDPTLTSSHPTTSKSLGSLSFSSNPSSSSNPRKLAVGEEDISTSASARESWEQVIARSKVEGKERERLKGEKEEREQKEKEKVMKSKKKEKKERDKKISMLSFDE